MLNKRGSAADGHTFQEGIAPSKVERSPEFLAGGKTAGFGMRNWLNPNRNGLQSN